MTNLQKYDKAFIDMFAVTIQDLNVGLVYQSIASWDSVGHMSLMTELEEVFAVMFDTDDIIDFSSYEKGKGILQKYGIVL